MSVKYTFVTAIAATALMGAVACSESPNETSATAQTAPSANEVVAEVRDDLAANPTPAASASSETLGEKIDDSIVTAKVKAALIESPDTKAHEINVETMEGVVQLSGYVDSLAAKDAATAVAKSVTGVKEVKNDLSLKTTS